MSNLIKQCETLDTRPYLQEILISSLDCWMRQIPFDHSGFPEEYQLLCREQGKIGWRQLFNGRLSNEWARLQDNHLHITNQHQGKEDGNLWSVSISCKIWSSWYEIWEIRNKDVHGHDEIAQNQIMRRSALLHLQEIYDMRDQMLPCDRDILMESCEVHSTKPTRTIQNWIHTYRSTAIHSVNKAFRRAISGVKSIRDYFRPFDPP